MRLRHTHFPYCLRKEKDGSWVLLNRLYTPVGFATKAWIMPEDYPVSVRIRRLTDQDIQRLSYNGEGVTAGRKIYLYGDSCNPEDSAKNMTAYLEKLGILMKRQIEEVGRSL